ncbi:hypothetical protein [Pedobacter sandarakinus]|uniref:hypothetical protein n=1 Tax=Pedobacter sandarakinus TaxID=353156 RepID=UPI002246B334|nr:hypothetical protein [Pedobacter sandarakinus]MCX2576351.1 hypothetical protein [Pedobacter sandarakinus]
MSKIINIQMIAFILLFLCCKDTMMEEKEIYLGNKRKINSKDDGCTAVDVLQIFPIKNNCRGKVESASVYVCKVLDTQDTLYVFDICGNVASSINSNFKDGFCILKKNIKDYPNNRSLKIYVPSDFIIADGSRFLYGKITMLID